MLVEAAVSFTSTLWHDGNGDYIFHLQNSSHTMNCKKKIQGHRPQMCYLKQHRNTILKKTKLYICLILLSQMNRFLGAFTCQIARPFLSLGEQKHMKILFPLCTTSEPGGSSAKIFRVIEQKTRFFFLFIQHVIKYGSACLRKL